VAVADRDPDRAAALAAAHRLDRGTYGTCQACGRPIGDERLEALPATRFCVEDQAKAEREPGFPGSRS